MKIVDPHCHFWNLSLNKHVWLISDIEEGHLGDYSAIRKNYLPSDLLGESKKYEIEKFVYIQCGWERSDVFGEIEWIQNLVNKLGGSHGIVGYIDFSQKNAAGILEKYLDYPNFRGIRQILSYDSDSYYRECAADYLDMPAWRENFSILNKHALCFDLQIYPEQVDSAIEVIRANPNVRFIVNHALMPKKRDIEYQNFWRGQLAKLTPFDNVFIKVSGFGMFEPNWTKASIQPFIETAIQGFGTHRAMFASNFPVDKLYGSYDDVYDAYFSIASACSPQERSMLFYENAARVYKI